MSNSEENNIDKPIIRTVRWAHLIGFALLVAGIVIIVREKKVALDIYVK